ncbi:MAG: hypothetical protein J7641_11330 [Cyanobacteria bacterium SID2]|nr:hypothetical protein [Cyanobacteria bacterium SID2]MBP0004673.1 hypothetical protein [Cyanobacteria bacterium SBC]
MTVIAIQPPIDISSYGIELFSSKSEAIDLNPRARFSYSIFPVFRDLEREQDPSPSNIDPFNLRI